MNRRLSLYVFIITFWAFIQISFTQSSQKTLPQPVIRFLASRHQRYHHLLWHNIRENWNRLSSNTRREIRNLGWAPPRPGRRFDSDGNSLAITDNNSGEDFLYMHRQMINNVNRILSENENSYGRVRGWTNIPAPGNSEWPVASSYTIPGNPDQTAVVRRWKTTNFYNNNIRPMERLFTNITELRRMTLGELGARMEVTVHGWMHLRFSERSSIYRPSSNAILPEIDEMYDDPSYNWLVDLYSSHVNPTFWKLHGWIDDRIEDWRRANGLSTIRWRGTWVGGPMSSVEYLWDNKEAASTSLRVNGHGHQKENSDKEFDVMMKVARIYAKEGIESNLADIVLLDPPKKSASKSKARSCQKKPPIKNRFLKNLKL